MLDPKTKARIAQDAELPIYNDLVLPGIGKKFSAIERFVYDHQPVNSADAETFREQLKAAIIEAREAEAERALSLIETLQKVRKGYDDNTFGAKWIDEAIENYYKHHESDEYQGA